MVVTTQYKDLTKAQIKAMRKDAQETYDHLNQIKKERRNKSKRGWDDGQRTSFFVGLHREVSDE